MTAPATTAIPCAVCGGRMRPELEAWDRNRESSEDRFHYGRCERCGTFALLDVPTDLARYYSADYHGMPAPEQLRARAASEQHKVDLLLRHVEPGRLIEIGPSFGAFAYAARSRGFDVTAIEMDAACCAYLEDVVGVRAIQSSAPETALPELEPARVIALWHVMEHVPDPVAVLAAAADRLEPEGVLAIAMPNPESLQFRLLRARWAHLDAPRHLHLIPLCTLIDRARSLGLQVVETTTDDPFGRHCNRWGWEIALRRRPAGGPSPVPVSAAGFAVARALRPVERRGAHGAAYTVLLRRSPDGP